ncbi:DUF2057 family protein [Vibrio europaeus]|uniref:DUF2057 family protein n=1 Tax=Vibrio europaeus TaxID=300876 RepID=UPI00148C5F70|nr:DUF2057 family protein [Vibrio europaeus]MDC5822531.1 DUF2057 domain-containing protein [Vibrio europaeus]MDC5869164.1 DUF2057 domain-containing protein [Vibrio europaeus]NOH23563.1 DUF2057 domain-containing protein [Vibrio europaeus]
MVRLVFVILLGFLSIPAFALELIPAKGVSVLYINGVETESKIKPSKIESGLNQVVIRMDKNMSTGSSANVFTSKPYVLSFEAQNGAEITLEHPIARSKMEAERVFENSNPEWILKQGDRALNYSQELLAGKSGFFPYINMDELLVEHNAQRGIYFNNGQLIDKPVEAQAIAVAATTTAAATSNSSKVEKTSPAKQVATSNVEQLKAWYLKSSKEERKAFRRWMIDQE